MIIIPDTGALPSSAGKWDLTRVLRREAKETETCRNDKQSNTCEKPGLDTGEILVVLLIASTIVVLCILVFLYMLHRRRKRLDALEDPKDHQELDDYGIGPAKQKPAKMPQAPPPTYERSQDRKAEGNWGRSQRDSTDSLTPSLRQAMGVTPRDTLANS
ncbi:hypothetical protein FSARC_8385 [Fusarium sarcochroum]|uniref:Uncharacterized protein n=1 Tax=Fusarium sarcochroum TaxID=1208366 RepID=A0A8H4TT50_9HYPO|nr:hypothetical protein FSARC_8385 [Fusarium sarcochroum]